MLENLKSVGVRYERRLSAVAFVGGFLWDNLMLAEIDRLRDHLVILGYLLTALTAICLTNLHRTRLKQKSAPLAAIGLIEFAMQFALGGLFSIFIVFYSRSGSLLTSAPFLLSLAALFIGNELFKKHYERFAFQMCVFFVALFSYCELVVPVLLRQMGDAIFLLSGVSSLLVFWGVMRIMRRVARAEVEANRRILWPLVVMVFIFFNFLYFNNMIPPIPLSLKEVGVYHEISRTRAGQYLLSFEPSRWYEFGETTSAVLHLVSGESAFALSSVYAPAALETDIVHRWEYYDVATRNWVTVNVVRFPISGGRLGGFRGFSQKENIAAGAWRVSVETARGQVIGRYGFDVVAASSSPALLTVAR